MKFAFSSRVVKPVAASGRLASAPKPHAVSARPTIDAACR
jgi:hypothetical protein